MMATVRAIFLGFRSHSSVRWTFLEPEDGPLLSSVDPRANTTDRRTADALKKAPGAADTRVFFASFPARMLLSVRK